MLKEAYSQMGGLRVRVLKVDWRLLFSRGAKSLPYVLLAILELSMKTGTNL